MGRAAAAASPLSPPPPAPPPTLLPAPFARAVSLAARSTSLAVRVGSLVGGYGLDAARLTTLSGLELARALVEAALSRAARDALASPACGPPAAADADAESVLAHSLDGLHAAFAHLAFWTSAGFHLSGSTLAAASAASQLVLSSCDQLFGSTASSRAVASIVTLVRRQFSNPATGACGERVRVLDLVLAVAALAYLQQLCRRSAAEERRRSACEEIIWDVVVLNDGERVDVDHARPSSTRPYHGGGGGGGGGDDDGDDDEAILARLKRHIVASLPAGATVSLSNSVSSVQTITVDIQGSQLPAFPTPPGAEIVETPRPPSASAALQPGTPRSQRGDASHRVVYRIARDRFRSTLFRRQDEASAPAVVELANDSSGSPGPTDDPPAYSRSPPASPVSSTGPGWESSAVGLGDCNKPRPSSSSEPTANQKKQPWPPTGHDRRGTTDKASPAPGAGRDNKEGDALPLPRPAEKWSALRQVLRGRGQSLSNIWNREETPSEATPSCHTTGPHCKAGLAGDGSGAAAGRPTRNPAPESTPRAGYVSIHERRRDSVVSQADSYSLDPNGELQPDSPTVVRTDYSAHKSAMRPASDIYPAGFGPGLVSPPSPHTSPHTHSSHGRSKSYGPSLYSLATDGSQSSLVLSAYHQKSAYHASDALATLRREGFVDGAFPAGRLLPNMARYMRFSSACYGSHFLRFMGISTELPALGVWDGTHHDVRHFVHHTESAAGNILLASFVDALGGADGSGATGTGVPLVHYISLDHAAKAVVLACRGTLGFEDVMADMTCEYDDLIWRGRRYKVHKGIHASARRLLYGDDGRVLVTIREALREFPNYGLVMCGHSLGGGVTSLLGVMLAQPNPEGPGFVISAEPHARHLARDPCGPGRQAGDSGLPSGRRIHVYAYGPPGVMSPSLRRITRGLITSVVLGNDMVPHLSLGLLHDLQALALAFKADENKTKAEIWRRMRQALQASWHRAAPAAPGEADEQWTLEALEALRASMKAAKLVPPGEVFAVESQRVLRRDAFVLLDEGPVGRPAQRVVLKYVRDVEARFSEVRFVTSMLTDHSPAKYEDALNKLRLGVVE